MKDRGAQPASALDLRAGPARMRPNRDLAKVTKPDEDVEPEVERGESILDEARGRGHAIGQQGPARIK